MPWGGYAMPITTKTTGATSEAQFEAQLRSAILRVFPWLPAKDITHQASFTFRFGKATITVNGDAKAYALGRADVLVRFRGAPLAVFELKRPGLPLTSDDEQQGLSYARMSQPQPPLVVVTNGKDTRLIETHTGGAWRPETPAEATLSQLITQAASVARGDLKRAVDQLMGSNAAIWTQAVRQATASAVEDLSGDWDEPLMPFVRDLLLPRKVTHIAQKMLEERQRLITIEGGPLAGKSNALRELVSLTEDHPSLITLWLDADAGLSLFERLALILADALDWPITAEEARSWLVHLSRADGPALVLAIDNVGPDRDDLRRDLETLTSNLFGPNLRVVLACDDTIADQLTTQRNGRGVAALGRRAARLGLGPLDNEEFYVAQAHLRLRRLTFVDGARHSNELRTPWLIRVMACDAASSEEYADDNLIAAMSPVPGLDLIDHARQAFDVSHGSLARYRELAQAVLADGQDDARPFELMLELMETFIVRRATALAFIDAHTLRTMIDEGLIREARSQSGENIYVIRLPELIASEIAGLVAAELIARSRTDPADAAEWVVGVASNLPLGDIIVAQAIIDAAIRNHGLSLQLIASLRARPPRQTTMAAGTRTAGWAPGLGIVNMTLQEGGGMLLEHNGRTQLAEPDEDEDDRHVAFVDIHPYLILSHLAGHGFEVIGADAFPVPRADPDLLVGVGSAGVLLRRPAGDPDVSAVPMHHVTDDLAVVCHKAGIVEPITWSLVRFFGREDQAMRDQFIDLALDAAEPSLLPRLDLALRQTANSADKPRAAWANAIRNDRLKPLLEESLGAYLHA